MNLYADSKLSEWIYCADFEKQERRFLRAFLRPGDIFVDVGANVGLFTLLAARYVGTAGRVYAFEPCRHTYERLLDNVALNRYANVSCHQLGLSDSCQPLSMTVSLDGFDAWNSVAIPTAGASFTTETVNATTWDDFAEAHEIVGRVAMMKIDVEGWESRILGGGSQSLSRDDAPVLQVEFTEQNMRGAGSSCANLYRTLEMLGFRIFTYDTRNRRLVHDPLRESYPYLNLIASKNPEWVTARLKQHPFWFWSRGYTLRWGAGRMNISSGCFQ
jgi:FkbM family methyltransferase